MGSIEAAIPRNRLRHVSPEPAKITVSYVDGRFRGTKGSTLLPYEQRIIECGNNIALADNRYVSERWPLVFSPLIVLIQGTSKMQFSVKTKRNIHIYTKDIHLNLLYR